MRRPEASPSLPDTFCPQYLNGNIAARFEEMTARYSGQLAVVADDGIFSYDTLNQWANRAAHAILERIGNHGGRVALLMEKGSHLIGAILAVLKTGAAYVPLDPAHPDGRCLQILASADCSLIICSPHLLSRGQTLAGDAMHLLCTSGLGSGQTTNPQIAIDPKTLAYIIFTSGSTGQPKGVMQNHRNALHYTRNYVLGIQLRPADRLSLLGSFSFGAATMDMLAGLMNGASLFPFDLRTRGLAETRRYLADRQISVFHAVPNVFRQLFRDVPAGQFPHMRVIDLGGETVLRRDVDLFQRVFNPGCTLVNGYGCTELNVICQWHISHHTQIPAQGVPVGKPVQGNRILLLDEQRQPVHRGQAGHVAIESNYLSLGYWGLPQVTAVQFEELPGGSRRFHCGDLGRWLEDGSLLLLGRRDSQVKIRGCRVELAEIERHLLDLKGVMAAVVVTVSRAGETILCAHLARQNHPQPAVKLLRQHLAAHLPDFMIPARFVFHTSLPQTATGKVDRAALQRQFLEGSAVKQAPSDGFLANLWCQTLALDHVPADANFFEMGGDSLLAMQILDAVQRETGVSLNLAAFLANPTRAAMADMAASAAPVLQSQNSARDACPEVFAAPLPMRRFLRCQAPNAVRVFYIDSDLDSAALTHALLSIVRRHRILSARIDEEERVCFETGSGSRFTLHQLKDPNHVPLEALAAFVHAPFSPGRGGLFKVGVLAAETGHWLAISAHHLVFDGLSWRILFNELSLLYESSRSSAPNPLVPLDWQYGSEAVESNDCRSASLAFWANYLDAMPSPPIHPHRAVQVAFEATTMILGAEAHTALAAWGGKFGASLNMVLLTLFSGTLACFFGVRDLVVQMPHAGRLQAAANALIGCFVRDLAIRTPVSPKMSWNALLTTVRAQCLRAFAHPGICFETDAHLWDQKPVFPFNFRMRTLAEGMPRLGAARVTRHEVKRPQQGVIGGVASSRRLICDVLPQGTGLAVTLIGNRRFLTLQDLQACRNLFEKAVLAVIEAPGMGLARAGESPPETSIRGDLMT